MQKPQPSVRNIKLRVNAPLVAGNTAVTGLDRIYAFLIHVSLHW